MKIIENKKSFYDKLEEINIWIINDDKNIFKIILDKLHFGEEYFLKNNAEGAFFKKRIYNKNNSGCNYFITNKDPKYIIKSSVFFNFFNL